MDLLEDLTVYDGIDGIGGLTNLEKWEALAALAKDLDGTEDDKLPLNEELNQKGLLSY